MAHAKPAALPPSIRVDRLTWCDEYKGPLADLLAAKVITQDQIPERVCATFYKGQKWPHPGPRAPRDEHWLNVRRSGCANLIVCVGIPCSVAQERKRQEEAARERQQAKQREERQKTRASAEKPSDDGDNWPDAWPEDEGHRHEPGAVLFAVNGSAIRVTGRFRLYVVRSSSGGATAQYGYACEFVDKPGESSFFAPHQLRDENGYETHLKLVHSA